jgi:hypothetical protein
MLKKILIGCLLVSGSFSVLLAQEQKPTNILKIMKKAKFVKKYAPPSAKGEFRLFLAQSMEPYQSTCDVNTFDDFVVIYQDSSAKAWDSNVFLYSFNRQDTEYPLVSGFIPQELWMGSMDLAQNNIPTENPQIGLEKIWKRFFKGEEVPVVSFAVSQSVEREELPITFTYTLKIGKNDYRQYIYHPLLDELEFGIKQPGWINITQFPRYIPLLNQQFMVNC